VAFLPGKPLVVSGGKDGTLRMWNTGSGRGMLKLQCHEARIDGIAVSPDGDTIVTASWDKTAVIRNGKTTRYRALVAHDDRVKAVAYCPGRNWFATGGNDGTVRVWDDAGGTEIARFATPDVRVFAVTWAPDSRRLLCGGSDNL